MYDDPKDNYAEVNGLEIYYEIHGAYMTIISIGEVISTVEREVEL